MRISDWSRRVLFRSLLARCRGVALDDTEQLYIGIGTRPPAQRRRDEEAIVLQPARLLPGVAHHRHDASGQRARLIDRPGQIDHRLLVIPRTVFDPRAALGGELRRLADAVDDAGSEENTSELQPIMRSSYPVI